MWACTRTSACIAPLRTVSVVVRAPGSAPAGSTGGRPGWASWVGWALGSRQSIEPVTGRFVDTTTCLQDKRDEVVLVGVLRRFDRGVSISRGINGPPPPVPYHRICVPWYYVTCTYCSRLVEYVHVYVRTRVRTYYTCTIISKTTCTYVRT